MLKRLNLKLYEYNDGLYVTSGDHNRVFGFTNEELKKAIGVKLNRELYLCYYIIYHIITVFYNDSNNYTYMEYTKTSEIVKAVDSSLSHIIHNLDVFVKDEIEENSFKTLALLWDELLITSTEETQGLKASRGSRTGFVKRVFNFLVGQGLFLEVEEKYYPKERIKAIITNYFEEERGRQYEILLEEEQLNAPYKPISSE